jgi:hypothetical protein
VSEATYRGGEVHNEPHNVLEIGTAGATFLLLSRLATGKKVSVVRQAIENPQFHVWS